MSKFTQSTESIVGYKIKAAQPISIKEWFTDNADLIDLAVDNNPLHYYEGMIAKDVESGQFYRWIEAADGEIAGGYTYGTYEHDGVVYTGRTFNFVPLGQRVISVPLAGTWPPTEDYPKNTIAIREFVDTDTYVGIFRKTNSGMPATWSEELRVAYAAQTTAAIEAIVIAMFAGTGGDFGSANTIARSDHTHSTLYMPLSQDGLLYRGNLDSGDNITAVGYGQSGYYVIPDGSDVPTGFPTTADTGLASHGATDSFIMKVWYYAAGEVIRIIEHNKSGTALCFQTFIGGGPWSGWTRIEASQAETLAGTVVNKFISPYALQNHEAWTDLTGALLNSWAGTIKYRKLSDGRLELFFNCNGLSATGNIAAQLPASHRPATGQIQFPAVFNLTGGDFKQGWISVDSTTGNISIYGSDAGSYSILGYFLAHQAFTLD